MLILRTHAESPANPPLDKAPARGSCYIRGPTFLIETTLKTLPSILMSPSGPSSSIRISGETCQLNAPST